MDLNRGFLWGKFDLKEPFFFGEGERERERLRFPKAEYLCFSLPLSLPPISDSHFFHYFLINSFIFFSLCTFLYSIHLLGNSLEIAGARVGGLW